MGVDVSKYILSQNPRPEKIIKVVAPENSATLHLHHS